VRSGVILLELANPLEELLSTALLEKTHERRAKGLAGI
jgi:hypothetical protein